MIKRETLLSASNGSPLTRPFSDQSVLRMSIHASRTVFEPNASLQVPYALESISGQATPMGEVFSNAWCFTALCTCAHHIATQFHAPQRLAQPVPSKGRNTTDGTVLCTSRSSTGGTLKDRGASLWLPS